MGCKVDALVEQYDLDPPGVEHDTVDTYLQVRWTGQDGRAADGYKTLTQWFNKRVLRQLYADHDRETLDVHLEQEYALITGDPSVERDELAASLSTDGLNITEIADDFVSWSTMRHHLKDCLGAEKDTGSATTDWEANSVEVSREQTAEKARSVLTSLASKGILPDAETAEVDVQVKLGCPECSVRVPFTEAIDRGYVCESHGGTDDVDEATDSTALLGLLLVPQLVDALARNVPDALAAIPL